MKTFKFAFEINWPLTDHYEKCGLFITAMSPSKINYLSNNTVYISDHIYSRVKIAQGNILQQGTVHIFWEEHTKYDKISWLFWTYQAMSTKPSPRISRFPLARCHFMQILAQVGEFCVSWIIRTVPLTQFLA